MMLYIEPFKFGFCITALPIGKPSWFWWLGIGEPKGGTACIGGSWWGELKGGTACIGGGWWGFFKI